MNSPSCCRRRRRIRGYAAAVAVTVTLMCLLAAATAAFAGHRHHHPVPAASRPAVLVVDRTVTSATQPVATVLAAPPGITLGPGAPTEPTPTTGTTQPETGPSGSGSPGFFDISGRIQKAINDWFSSLVTSALSPILGLFTRTILASPTVTSHPQVVRLWHVTLGIADSAFVLIVLAGGLIVMTHETVQTRYALKDVLPRLVAGFVLANTSLPLVGALLPVANSMVNALFGGMSVPADTAKTLSFVLLTAVTGNIFLTLLGGVAVGLGVVVILTYLVRVVLLVLLVVAAPLVLIAGALPSTDNLTRWWWRALGGCAAIQLGQALLLAATLRIFFDNNGGLFGLGVSGGLINILIVLALLWLLVKLPIWTLRLVFQTSPPRPMLRQLVTYQLTGGRALLPAVLR